jgi:hypothetical protein
MNKERELLKRVRDTLHELEETHYDLYWDIQAELDLDEQKPVAWMYQSKGFRGEQVLINEKQDMSAELWVESPLYHGPPKREPPQTSREMYQRGYAAAKRELKPLSEATIAELWGEEHSGSTSMVKNYARAIEKMHGITGETK